MIIEGRVVGIKYKDFREKRNRHLLIIIIPKCHEHMFLKNSIAPWLKRGIAIWVLGKAKVEYLVKPACIALCIRLGVWGELLRTTAASYRNMALMIIRIISLNWRWKGPRAAFRTFGEKK